MLVFLQKFVPYDVHFKSISPFSPHWKSKLIASFTFQLVCKYLLLWKPRETRDVPNVWVLSLKKTMLSVKFMLYFIHFVTMSTRNYLHSIIKISQLSLCWRIHKQNICNDNLRCWKILFIWINNAYCAVWHVNKIIIY